MKSKIFTLDQKHRNMKSRAVVSKGYDGVLDSLDIVGIRYQFDSVKLEYDSMQNIWSQGGLPESVTEKVRHGTSDASITVAPPATSVSSNTSLASARGAMA